MQCLLMRPSFFIKLSNNSVYVVNQKYHNNVGVTSMNFIFPMNSEFKKNMNPVQSSATYGVDSV